MATSPQFNRQIRQIIMLSLLILMIFLVIKELYVFLPGLLGAVTLYILGRNSYFQLVYHRKWRKGWTAGLYLLAFFLLPASIVYFTFSLLEKQLHPFLSDPSLMFEKAKEAIHSVQQRAGVVLISEETLTEFQKKLSVLLAQLVNNTVNLLANQAILLFVLYYMLVHCKEMESYLSRTIPLKKTNVNLLANETKRLIKASALGIPLISIIQGITAMIGYIIFGLHDYVLWGFLTGIFAFFPVVGTMMIWIPLVTFMYMGGDTWNATGLFFYSLIVTGNIDYISRITILKKLGHVHPVVTVLGVIVGLGLFGFIGFIFGPLLLNYITLIFKIYINEFVETNA
ncbi:MAG TPA: AI-2E family transporter [Chitinophagaceae bacterium]|jgi:predicted PurR-regulated permease PerM|nr:AI-2E family transporter [Chitinophagaceae bacterium]